MDFVTGLPISTNWKGESYDSILLIVNLLTKMVYYEPVKVTINALGLAKVILDVVIWHHSLPNSIVFAYNNAKNASTSHTPFELNCGYHP